jgi:uridine kinase
MTKMETKFIGICGRSCSGKSTLSKKLVSNYPDLFDYIPADKFTISCDNQNRSLIEWERPECLRIDKLINCLIDLKTGKTTKIPSKRCTEIFDKEILPKTFVIVDGFLLFTNKKLIDLFDYKFYIDITDDQILKRRLLRKENDSLDDINYIKEKIIPISKEYESIQKQNADMILSFENSFEKSYDIIKNKIFEKLI